MNPQKTYIVCATQRSGSTLLCDLLYKSGAAGNPKEFLLTQYEPKEGIDISKYDQYVQTLLSRYASDNGVSGVKLMEDNFALVVERLRKSLHLQEKSDVEVLEPIFPNLSFIFITRKDKIRQAISLSRAEQSKVWEKRNGSDNTSQKGENIKITPHYIKAAYNRIIEKERFWLDFFETQKITPYLITYEELTQKPSKKTLECLSYIGIVNTESIVIGKPSLQKQSDIYTEFLILEFKLYFAAKKILPDQVWQILKKFKQLIANK